MRWWRGLLTVLTWLVWPLVWLVIMFSLTWRGQCDADPGCAPPDPWWLSALWAVGLFLPPVLVTLGWWRWKRKRHAETT